MKSCLILTFLLGVTWSVGFAIHGEFAVYTAYAFVALNSSVGLFLFLHTIFLNENIAGEFKARLGLIARVEFRLELGRDHSRAVGRGYSRRRRSKGERERRERTEFHRKTDRRRGTDSSFRKGFLKSE